LWSLHPLTQEIHVLPTSVRPLSTHATGLPPVAANLPGRRPVRERSRVARSWIGRIACAVGTSTLAAAPSAAQQQDHQHGGAAREIAAVRVESGPIIDGVLNEAVWQSATLIDQFTQQEPAEGEPASERTEVRVLYDESTLYFGVRAYDALPDALIATEMRRDSDRLLEEDNVQIILDTFRDFRSGYMFVTTPLGAKLDQQIFEEGEGGRRGQSSNINREWDGVWHVSTQVLPDGWAAEIAIPMVTLRFPAADAQVWGINIMRNIRRKNEQVFWAPIPKAYGLTRVSLAGTLTDLRALDRGRDLRFKPSFVGGGRRVLSLGETDNTIQRDVALDLKYGITAGLNLDVTVNTDFAQAEVDDERVNLTRFPLFFPEKREFFLENSGQFSVGATASLDRPAELFFSRRVGIDSETGARVPILGGARLTGKLGKNNIAVMDLQTDDFDVPGGVTLPGENFLVARYSRDVLTRSKIGAIFVNKDATSGGRYNRTFGADMTLALTPSLTVQGFVAKTSTPELDGDDVGGHLRAAFLDQRWNIYGEHTNLQDNFNAEVGYVPRVGIKTTKFHLERNPRPGRFGIRVLEPMHNTTYTTDQSNRLLSRRFHNMVGTRFENGAYLNVFFNHYFERLDEPFRVARVTENGQTRNVTIDPGKYSFGEVSLMFNSNPARRVYYTLQYSPQQFYDGDRTDMSTRLGVRVSSRLATEAGISRNDVNLPAGAFKADVGSVRIDLAISPSMTLRTLTQYNSSTDQWSTSGRFNWTYRPGSDIYIVYDDVRRDIPGQPPGLDDFADKQLIIKFTYLLSR
jgi:hypothetical protein